MLFINTRPEDRAVNLTQALLDVGHQVINLPLLELVAEPFSGHLRELYQQLEQVQVIVVVSPTAVDVGMQYLQQQKISLDQLKHVQWIAVGQATAQALAKFNVDSHIPEVENSEGMLDLPILNQHVHLDKVAFWRGFGGRQFMMQQLQQQGVEILNFVLYRRQCPIQSVTLFPKILKKIMPSQPVMVLISSEASWNNWQQLCGQNNIDAKWIYLALGERLAQLLKNARLQTHQEINIIQLDNLSISEIIQRIGAWQGRI